MIVFAPWFGRRSGRDLHRRSRRLHQLIENVLKWIDAGGAPLSLLLLEATHQLIELERFYRVSMVERGHGRVEWRA